MITVGSHLGPYEVVARIGAGGMGEVWRGRDQRLQRDVAIKVLPEAMMQSEMARSRFEREARAVAALSHPNVLAIHDFGMENGVAYAVMELLEGATLRDRLRQADLTVSRALDWSHQIARGLAAAHERGVIHRDLKPENIFVTRDGVKILDFGLARLDAATASDSATLVRETSPGALVGTIGYLSPEQARGETADHRSDIFAFGAVFFEMLAGQPAFLRSSAAETMVAVLREEPKPLAACGRNVPPEVEDILRHCLEKNPDDRFRSARDLAFALQLASRSGSAATTEVAPSRTPRSSEPAVRAGEISIAVLPFRNMSPSPDAEYFSDGMTEEIINSISNIPALHVAARTSSFAFKGRNDDVRKIGRELGVSMVLDGSVRQLGGRLRVSAQLINVESGYQVWSERWDRELADVFAVQDEIAQAIAGTFKLRVGSSDPGTATGKTQKVEAYERYLKGRYFLARRRMVEAIGELEAAVESDPDFADAHTAIADAWAIRGFYGGVPTWEAWARARAAADQAERIAPDVAGVALSRAICEHFYGWDTARYRGFCRLAIERNPKSADGWNWLGLCEAASGQRNEALEHTARGIELEPYNANIRTSAAWASMFVGDYETAARVLANAIELDPNALALWTHSVALRMLRKFDESLSILVQLVESSQRKPTLYLGLLGATLAAASRRSEAEAILDELLSRRARNEFVASLDIAEVLTPLGDHEGAVDALERAREERNALLWSRIYFPTHIPLRTHPRWNALAEKLGRSAPVSIAT